MDYNIFGFPMRDPADTGVAVKASPSFLAHYQPSERVEPNSIIVIPVDAWLDAFHAGRAPRLIPARTHRSLLDKVPMNVLSMFFI